MIECICIDDSVKPNDIPLSKWVEKGKIYHVIYATVLYPQNVLAFQLYEVDLDDSCYPYQYFSSTRFAISSDQHDEFMDLILNSREADMFLANMMA